MQVGVKSHRRAATCASLAGGPMMKKLLTALLFAAPCLFAAPPAFDDRVMGAFVDPPGMLAFRSLDAALQAHGDYDAVSLCAAIAEYAELAPDLAPTYAELRKLQLDDCRARYPVSQKLLRDAKAAILDRHAHTIVLKPQPDNGYRESRHAAIAREAHVKPDGTVSYMGIYAPPPAGDAWLEANVAGRDYRTDVKAVLDANPLVASVICEPSALPPATKPHAVELRAQLGEVCKSFPDERLEMALRKYQFAAGREWLNAKLNLYLDEAVGLSADGRRMAGESVISQIKPYNTSDPTRFELALHALALRPDYEPAIVALVRFPNELSSSNGGASEEVARTWIVDTFRNRSARADGIAWKRGLLQYLVLTGDLAGARSVARELGTTTPLDRIYGAMIERALGNRVPYDTVLANCPEPDADYIRTHGVPGRKEAYCEDVIAAFARDVRDIAGANRAPQFAEMLFETNRTLPLMPGAAPMTAKPAAATRMSDTFGALVRKSQDEAAQMSSAERERAANDLLSTIRTNPRLEPTLRYLTLDPSRPAGPVTLLQVARGDRETGRLLLDLATAMYERNANAASEDRDDWRRAWRLHLLLTGEFEKARRVGQQLAGRPSRDVARDQVIDALIAWHLGDPAPYHRLPSTCAGSSEAAARRMGSRPQKPYEYCAFVAVSLAGDAVRTFDRETSEPFRAVLREAMVDPSLAADMRANATTKLFPIEDEAPAASWKTLLHDKNLNDANRSPAYFQLALIAERRKDWTEALAWMDTFLSENQVTDVPLQTADWRSLADSMNGDSDRGLWDAVDHRLIMAIGKRDYASARQSIEIGIRSGGDSVLATHALLELALAEADAGLKEEPLRIGGYVSTQKLGAMDANDLKKLREKLGAPGKPADLKPQNAPWAPRPRVPLPRMPQGEPAPSTKGIKT